MSAVLTAAVMRQHYEAEMAARFRSWRRSFGDLRDRRYREFERATLDRSDWRELLAAEATLAIFGDRR